MYKIIEEYSQKNNILFGITNAKLRNYDFDIISIPFSKVSAENRQNPALFLKNAKSIIALGIPNSFVHMDRSLTGIIARSLSSIDYHLTARTVATGLVKNMLERFDFKYKIQVDTGPMFEKGLALEAGLGFIGRNHLLINEKIGSFFNIALIVTDLEIDHNIYEKSIEPLKCNSCMRCVNNCPSEAIKLDGSFSYENCVSYITQKKGILSEYEISLIKFSIYGCDICQNVCLYNKANIHDTFDNTEQIHKNLLEILNLSKREYDIRFKNSHFYWRGRTTILRNCLIFLYKLGYQDEEVFLKYLKGDNKILSLTAEYCLKAH